MSGVTQTDPAAGGSVMTLPKGGGAVGGLSETFTPDLFTGTGNLSVPIELPAGRLGVQPQLALAYSTGGPNGAFGLGWQVSLPGVARKTSRGVPRYVDDPGADRADVFLLSGAEDLVPVSGAYPGRVSYRPRTEGLFARIEHVRDASGDYWEVRSRDGLLTQSPGTWARALYATRIWSIRSLGESAVADLAATESAARESISGANTIARLRLVRSRSRCTAAKRELRAAPSARARGLAKFSGFVHRSQPASPSRCA
jgi:Salmonella virulence plasmid 65kDa B protein